MVHSALLPREPSLSSQPLSEPDCEHRMTVEDAVERQRRFPADSDREYRMLIGGDWVPAASGATFQCVDPYLAKPWGQIPVAGDDDVDRAVTAARRAFDESGWPQTSPAHRASLL